MKKLKLLLLIFTLPIFGQAQRTLTVTNGSGDARIRGQQIVHVWADPNPAGMVFDRWTGDTFLVQNPREYHTKVNALSKNVNITATYKSAPVWTPTYETINGTLAGYYFPAAPVGVIFHFHGASGDATQLFTPTEERGFANDAVAENYAVVALSSAGTTNNQWNTNPQIENNPDMQNVRAAINLFIARGWISASTPIFANGVSNGGGFAPLVSRTLNFRATSLYISSGLATTMAQTTVPTIWNLIQNDRVLGTSGFATANSNYQNLLSRGVRASYNILAASPVYPERFWRIAGLTAADSQTIYNALKQNGFLDGRDYLIADPSSSNWRNVIPSQYVSYLTEINAQLTVSYAQHMFFSDYNRRVLDFFNASL